MSTEEQLALAIESLSELLVLFDADDRIVIANRAWRDFNKDVAEFSTPGTRFEDHLRALIEKRLVPEASGREEAWFRERMERHRNPRGPFEVARQDGRTIRVSEQHLPNAGTILIISDITESKRVEQALQKEVEARRVVGEALKEREEQSARLVKNLPGIVYLCDYDEDWTMRFVSEGARAILGYAPDDLIGNRVVAYADLMHADDREAVWLAARRDLAAHKACEYEYRIRTASGSEKTLWDRAHGVYDESGRVIWIKGYIEDITSRKQVEERLRQALKMEAVGQLTGGVAHDFNNLLAVIMGNSELLEDRLGAEDKRLKAILRAATRGSELTQRLLAFSRQQSLRPETIDLGTLVSGMSELLIRTLGETIEIETRAAPGSWIVTVDPGQVENALLNLALNARDAMPGGGNLIIECENAHLDDAGAAQIPEAMAGDYVVLAVSDSGMGMSAEVQDRAFEPFFTTKDVGKGSGLGLSMVYGFAKQSGGLVTIYSELNRGTTVKLYLPRAKEVPLSETVYHCADIPRGRNELILVIEDNADVRDLAVRSLEGLGYRVIEVPDAASARMLLAKEAQVDLVLSDVILPGGISGPEFAEEARRTRPDLKIIFMSGYPAEAIKRNSFLDADNVLLNKPFQRQQLAKALRQALN